MQRVLFALVFSASFVPAAAAADQLYDIQRLGLSASAGTVYHNNSAQVTNAAGAVIGYETRSNSASNYLGIDAWLRNASGTTVQLGLTGTGYNYVSAAAGGTYRYTSASLLNAAGQVVGYSSRYGTAGNDLGTDAWLYTASGTQVVGLVGTNYEYTVSGVGTYRSSSAARLTDAGRVSGNSSRFTTSGGSLGIDAWQFNGTTTQVVGLIGTGYEYAYSGTGTGTYRTNYAYGYGPSGQVVGASNRYNTSATYLGRDAWIYTGSATTKLPGLTGAGYDYTSTAAGGGTYHDALAFSTNAAGQASGMNFRVDAGGISLGQDAWVYNGSTTRLVGLTGTGYEYAYVNSSTGGGTYRSTTTQLFNATGKAAGYTTRYPSANAYAGQDAWVDNGSNTQLIGLTGTGYEYTTGGTVYRNGSPSQINNAGQVTGYAQRYSSTGANLGSTPWLYNGTNTRPLGLTGPGYEYTPSGTTDGVYRYGFSGSLNAAGQVVGFSNRYNTSGQTLGTAGWFYDPTTDVSTPLVFSTSTTGYANTSPGVLTDAGLVLGSYELYSGSTDKGSRAFMWSATAGFKDIGSLVKGGLSPSQWLSLSYAIAALGTLDNGYPNFIVGTGTLPDGTYDVYLLTAATPEPTALLLAAAAVAPLALARRRRHQRRPA